MTARSVGRATSGTRAMLTAAPKPSVTTRASARSRRRADSVAALIPASLEVAPREQQGGGGQQRHVPGHGVGQRAGEIRGGRGEAVGGRGDEAEGGEVRQGVVQTKQEPAGGRRVEEGLEGLEGGREVADDEDRQRGERGEERRRERREEQRDRGEDRQLQVDQRDRRPQRGQQGGGAGTHLWDP